MNKKIFLLIIIVSISETLIALLLTYDSFLSIFNSWFFALVLLMSIAENIFYLFVYEFIRNKILKEKKK
jgi:hypothetical protein